MVELPSVKRLNGSPGVPSRDLHHLAFYAQRQGISPGIEPPGSHILRRWRPAYLPSGSRSNWMAILVRP